MNIFAPLNRLISGSWRWSKQLFLLKPLRSSGTTWIRRLRLVSAGLVILSSLGGALLGVWPQDFWPGRTEMDTGETAALEVVFVADFSGAGKLVGEDLAKGFREAVEAGGVAKDIRLVVRDDRGQAEASSALAESAAAGFQTLALIGPGNVRGYDAFVAAGTEGELPVIVPVAPPKTAEDPKWVFTMQPNQQRQGELTGRLVQKLGPVKRVAFLQPKGMSSGYWSGITASFSDSNVDTIEMRVIDEAISAADLLVEARQLSSFDLIFIDLPASLAVQVIKLLKDADHAGRIVGFGDMALPDFAKRFKDFPKEQLAPGFYANGIFAVAPFSPDISGERSRHLTDSHHQRTGKDPSWAYAYGYDAGALLADFINMRKAAGKTPHGKLEPEEWRSALRDHLQASRVASQPTSAFTGPIIFDATNQRDTQPALIVYKDQRPTPYLLQYSGQPAQLDTQGANQNSSVVIEDRRYDFVPVVFSGLRFNSIEAIDLEKGQYTADLDVWFRSLLAFSPDDVIFPNAIDGTLETKVVESIDTPLEKYRRMRIKGKFLLKTTPRDLVLEQITLSMALRHRSLEASELRFVVDSASFNSVTINSQVHQQINRDGVLAPSLGYLAVRSLLAVENRAVRGLGDPRARSGQLKYSELELQLQLDSATATLGPTLARSIHWSLSLGMGIALLVAGFLARRHRLHGGRLHHWSSVLQVLLLSGALLLAEVSLFGSPLLESMAQRWVVWIRNAFMLGYHISGAFLVDCILWWVIRRRRGGRLVQGTIHALTSSTIFFAAFAAYYTNVLGRDFLPILATSSVLLTVVGLALRELILDSISGIALNMEETLKIGHWIMLKTREQTLHGVIEELGWRNVRMRSRDDQVHFIPNSLLFHNVISNFSTMSGFTRVSIPFEVSSNTDLGLVIERVSLRVSELLTGDPDVDVTRPIRVICTEIESDKVEMTAQVFYRAEKSFDTLSTRVLKAVSETVQSMGAMPVHRISLNEGSRRID
jgi:potassium-dependent mechanosensitive channel